MKQKYVDGNSAIEQDKATYISTQLRDNVGDIEGCTVLGKGVEISKDGATVTGTIGENGNVTWGTLSYWNGLGDVNTTYSPHFGKLTDYSATDPTKGSNWRLFYADNEYAYLISDSIGDYDLNDTTLFSDFSLATISTLGKALNSKCSDTFWTKNAENVNIKAISGLLNTSKWTAYENSAKGTEWAIGAPTLEMFIKSYNATHTSEAITAYKATTGHSSESLTETQLDCEIGSNLAFGYYVKNESDGWFNNYTFGLGNSSEIDVAIYCADSATWWLASPSANNGCVVNAYCSGGIHFNNYSGSGYVRPLVCVPISNIGTSGQNKTITISDNYFNE